MVFSIFFTIIYEHPYQGHGRRLHCHSRNPKCIGIGNRDSKENLSEGQIFGGHIRQLTQQGKCAV